MRHSLRLVLKRPSKRGGEVVFAIFVDDKFVKFVKWFPAERIHVPYEGTTRSYPKPIKIGNVQWLIRAVESGAANIADLEKEFRLRPPVPDQVDPGLTIAYLLLRAAGRAPGVDVPQDYKRNAELRDQFNAARLSIGMSVAEVEAVFKAKPLETSQVAAGTVKVYGSDESLDYSTYSNVLILLKESKVSVIYAIEGGPDSGASAQEQFSDFPR